MPYLLFLKKQQNLKWLSAANYRPPFMGNLIDKIFLCIGPDKEILFA